MTPVYLLQMYKLKDEDADIWEFFMNGYFSINKTSVPLTATGADHAIEHENRTMKVLGGIKGIANGIKNLKYFITAPEINQIIRDFCEAFDIEDYNGKRVVRVVPEPIIDEIFFLIFLPSKLSSVSTRILLFIF